VKKCHWKKNWICLWSKSWIIREQGNLSLGETFCGWVLFDFYTSFALCCPWNTPSFQLYQHLWTAITSVKTGMPWQLTHLSCTSTTQNYFNWWQHSIERMTLFLLISIDKQENVKKSLFSFISQFLSHWLNLSQTRFVVITDSTDSMSGKEIIWFNFGPLLYCLGSIFSPFG